MRQNSARALMSRPAVGSSSSSKRGPCSSARAISTRRICPPERSRALSCARSASPTRASSRSAPRVPSTGPMPCKARVIGEVLLDAEIGIERALLKHDAEPAQRRAAAARDVETENAHAAAARRIKMRDHEREQRALARAVEAEQHGEAGRRDVEAHVVERDARAIGMRDDFRPRARWRPPSPRFGDASLLRDRDAPGKRTDRESI